MDSPVDPTEAMVGERAGDLLSLSLERRDGVLARLRFFSTTPILGDREGDLDMDLERRDGVLARVRLELRGVIMILLDRSDDRTLSVASAAAGAPLRPRVRGVSGI